MSVHCCEPCLYTFNDLEEGIESSVKFFADDTSFFSIVKNPQVSAVNLQHDLNMITEWAYQWKMSFNPDPSKQAEEILFSQKLYSPIIHQLTSIILRLKGCLITNTLA